MNKIIGCLVLGAGLSTALIMGCANTSTGPGSGSSRTTVNLRSAAPFAVLAYSMVTNVPTSDICGDLGLSPGTSAGGGYTFNCGGVEHITDTTAAKAKLDLTTAFNDAAGRTIPILVAGNIGGQTLYPGLYKSTGSLEISSGDLTLDAQGNSNAVFIFQIASTLTTTSSRQVILAGGAKAGNIFWQVGSMCALGTSSVFKGTIMAYGEISMDTLATLEGRALSETSEVTLDSNTITVPTP